ncbi:MULTISPECIES: DoxX family protein [unclassified Aeromicrobium]|jgi:putative oxidoreductase|uniref:DoxX family protein n=1 Tax=unclassified Aeromicrobium TaxID=2633570 RepID=UPI002097C1B2|nr:MULTISPECIES: DoxX family protein [unclassified Aeromicrobium]MCO7237718.1 DoxX family protein [Aeromicrobium sp. CnD17-E]MDR6117678.1 putative oxidoreductase [Aeromicrobium sp. SORGH_AS_0981]
MSTIARTLDHRRHATAQDLGLLIGRAVVGVTFVVHGWQKWSGGIGGTQDGFAAMGVPLADVSAVALATLEVVGGALLVLGALTTVVAPLLGLGMLGAAWYAHRDAFLVSDGGSEFVLVLAAVAFLLALVGPGRWSVDALAARGRR